MGNEGCVMHGDGEVHEILSFAIEPIYDEERAILLSELKILVQKDPSLRVEVKSFAEKLVISGEDESQLRKIQAKIPDKHQAQVGELQISFRETIRKPAEGEGKYIRHSGSSGNYGHCKIRVEPNQPGKGFEFIEEIGGVIPKEDIKAVEQGIREAALGGVLRGYEVVDFRVTLYDGSYHEADSNEMAFRIAGSLAFREAARKANPVVLEPMMAVEATVHEESMPATIQGLNSRRGRIEGMEYSAGLLVIRAIVPLAEILSSSSGGRLRCSMRFAGYEAVPPRPFDDDASSYAKKPSSPRPKPGSAAAELED
jgi:elongation factor G